MGSLGQPTSRTGLTRKIILLSAPLIAQNLSATLLGVVDTFFVSRVSTASVAAVGVAAVMFFAVLVLFKGIANASVVFVGRAYGARDFTGLGLAVWQVLNLVFWLSIISLVFPWVLPAIFTLIAPPDSPTVAELGSIYVRLRAFEFPFHMFMAVVWGFLVGRNDSRTPMILAWIIVLLNIFFDWLLVLGNLGLPRLGVEGAAWASLIAVIIGALLHAWVLWRPVNRQTFHTGRFIRAGWPDLRRIAQVGLPMGLGDFIEVASFSVFFAIMARLGTDITAANQIALQYMSMSFTAGIAIAMACSSLVSQYLGAKEPDKAEQVAYRACFLAMLVMGIVGLTYLIAPESLMEFFSRDPEVIAAGVLILKLVALYQVFDAVAIVLGGALNGAGDTTFTMVTKMCLAWGGFIPLTWLLTFPLGGGLRGAWIAALGYLTALGLVYFIRFRSGRWKALDV